jgi:hypothetical protein
MKRKQLLFTLLLSLICSNWVNSQIIVDNRSYQSPVKNQKNRGTCTAFAIIAAMETLPGMPIDLSEQYIYAQAKLYHYNEMPEYSEGASLKFYVDRLTYDGTLREDQAPYNPDLVMWNKDETNIDKMKKDLGGSQIFDLLSFQSFAFKILPGMYTYRNGKDAKNVEWIKNKLDGGIKCIPVCYGVNGKYWSAHKGDESSKIDPNDFLIISDKDGNHSFKDAKAIYKTNDLYPLLADGTLNYSYTDTLLKVNEGHAVAIVGYDATGFLIKNSWGADQWGDKGYGWVSFDYHRLYGAEVLTLPLGKVAVEGWAEPLLEGRNKESFRLKSLPYESYDVLSKSMVRGISLSVVFYGEGKMPRFTEIEYKGYDISGKLLGTWYGTCQGIFDGRETGYANYIFLQNRSVFPNIYKMTANMKTKSGWNFQNTYYNLIPKNQEYKVQ